MNASEELRDYVARLHTRLRLGAIARGAAVLGGIALGLTPLLVVFANRYAFSAASVHGSRLVLLAALCAGAVLGLAIPLWRLNHQRVIRRAEARFPQFEERLRTFTQREAEAAAAVGAPGSGAFGELLAADTLRVARTAQPASLVPKFECDSSATRGDIPRWRSSSAALIVISPLPMPFLYSTEVSRG